MGGAKSSAYQKAPMKIKGMAEPPARQDESIKRAWQPSLPPPSFQ